ncbi:MAG: HAMP domain-containing histidine kinase [Roseovarius sp.]|uniref:sensor histidine kinase n=1 Tax=Roseovarius sp. TaxID=1486281 RepID=UPI001B7C8ADC|nr:HAMP domain-containing sensor histidine kinase [Roseovarius sp.]MBQ0750640.1 HAMP domain-containing histidine kinase [Roseovarius sp.]MBQ0810601.1 HAMP domain-containing histidine kinase [Roseovarius sp.]
MTRSPSLKRPLIVYPLVFHFLTLLASFSILIAVALRIDSGGPYTDERIIPIIADAVARDAAGGLSIVMTPELADLRTEATDLWFVAEDDGGASVVFGTVPENYASLLGRLSDLSYAQLRDRVAPYDLAAVIRRENTDIGALTILGHGALSELGFMVVFATNTIILPIFVLLTLTSLVVTPWIVRRSLAGVSRIAREAEEIDANSRGRRLSEAYVPQEIAPLVRAVNDALRRLDDGYERQQRFIASASHELRTPIAVLASKVDAADSKTVRALALDVQRIATMTEQLLDLHRLENNRHDVAIDLAEVGRRVVGDLAPLVIANGGSISLEVVDNEPCIGDVAALERVLVNLVQNAIDHGGTNVVVRVLGAALEVEDDGPGIPPTERERVFEPFHRLRPRATGSGLGLNLVQEVMDQHGGRVEILDAPSGGTVFRVDLGAV